MNAYLQLIEDIQKHVISLFDKYQTKELLYHNLEHTKTVVQRVSEIAAIYNLSDIELLILLAAAWFHDTGHLTGNAKSHEDRSVLFMKKFLEPKNIAKDIIDKIENCICATKLPQTAKSLLEETICDAVHIIWALKLFL